MRLAPAAGRRIAIQIVTLLLIVIVGDYLTDTSFPHHWIIFVIAAGLLAVLLVVYMALGPDN